MILLCGSCVRKVYMYMFMCVDFAKFSPCISLLARKQDLLNLFIEHQVPSDLLSYDGDPAAHVSTKLAAVKQCVQNMQEMIDRASKVH